jgi:hypothetical protein
MRIVNSILNDRIGAAKLWYLERTPANEFGQDCRASTATAGTKEKINVAFAVDTKGKSLEEVGMFPVMTTEEIAQKAPESERELTAGGIGRRQYQQARKVCGRCLA